MASLYVAEFSTLAPVPAPGGGGTSGARLVSAQSVGAPPLTEQKIAIAAGSAASAAFNASTRMVRIHTDAICSIAFGTPQAGAATATANNMRLAANQTEYFGVTPGMFVSVITNT